MGPDPLQFVDQIEGNLDTPTRGLIEATWALGLTFFYFSRRFF